MRILIATGRYPNKDKFEVFVKMMRESAAEGDLVIPPGVILTSGPGCANLAFDVIGPDEEAERFANALTIALGIAKWCTTPDALPEVDTYDLEN